jgi:alpha-tubulin suppressor-like RCC1 family protein
MKRHPLVNAIGGMLFAAASFCGPAHAAVLTGVANIGAGFSYSCAVMATGAVKCWGWNEFGQLGNPEAASSVPGPVDVQGLQGRAIAVDGGFQLACALLDSGGVQCWGGSGPGGVGDGTGLVRPTPVEVLPASAGVRKISVGDDAACALLATGGVKCWGANNLGQLGDGTFEMRLAPVDVPNLSAIDISMGAGVACAVTTARTVKCWGFDFATRVPSSPVPQEISGTARAAAVAVSGSGGCALFEDRVVRCWGAGSAVPIPVPGLDTDIITLSASPGHACALNSRRGLQCWGSNDQGQLGGVCCTAEPVRPPGLTSGVMRIATGMSHTCVVMIDDTVRCFGSNSNGQLGLGVGAPDRQATPMPVGLFASQTVLLDLPPIANLNEGTLAIRASASSGLPVRLLGASDSPCVPAGASLEVSLVRIGLCSVIVDQPGDAQTLPARAVVGIVRIVGSAPGALARPVNLSARGYVGTGDDALIAGFVVGGDPRFTKQVVVVATGPSLGAAGVPDALSNPRLTVFRADGSLAASNDDWQSQSRFGGTPTILEQIGLAPGDTRDAAVLVTLRADAAYTAVVQGVARAAGAAVIGVYEIDVAQAPLANVSARGRVTAGAPLIAGFVVDGTQPRTIAITGAGPSLAAAGVTDALANPTLTLLRASDQSVIASNDDWMTGDATSLVSLGLAPGDPRESGIVVTLPPGAYTAMLGSANQGAGIGVIGVYAK